MRSHEVSVHYKYLRLELTRRSYTELPELVSATAAADTHAVYRGQGVFVDHSDQTKVIDLSRISLISN